MKILRSSALLLLGLSLSVPAALACDHSSGGEWIHQLIHPEQPQGDINHPDRQCDQNGQNSGRGNNCDRGRGNGGGYCGVDTSTSDSGGGNGNGDTTVPPLPKS